MPIDWKNRKRCHWCSRFISEDVEYVKDGTQWLHEICEKEMLDLAEGLISFDQLQFRMKNKKGRRKGVRRKQKTVARKVRQRSR